jgi:hypothetical protein
MTVNIPAEVRRALALAAKAEIERAGRLPTAGELARHTGWGKWTAKQVVAGLRRDGLWPDLPSTAPVPVDVPPPPKPARAKPDIAAECAKIREDWSEAKELDRRASGRRVEARVPYSRKYIDGSTLS